MTEASKVLHLRNVGPEIAENDLLQLVQAFGIVEKMVVIRAKNQALLQMQDVASAINVMHYYSQVQPSVRGRNVYIQFSSHKELTISDQSGQTRRPSSDQEQQPNRILLITVHNPLYPITVDVLHQVFFPHGFVEKIVTFQKSAGLQALVQFSTQQSALIARNLLQGRNVYDGCCTLDIQFSNLKELQVNYNNDRTRDFTNPSLPSEQVHSGANAVHNNLLAAVRQLPERDLLFRWTADLKCCIEKSYFGEAANIYSLQPGTTPGFQQTAAHQGLGLNSYQMPLSSAAVATTAFGGNLPPGIAGTNERSTLLVSNLNHEKLDADKLFNLFSNYGNISRIKFLHNKPDHALIQMGDGFQAELALNFLKGTTLFGKKMEVNYSKHPQINPSADTHDYSSSNLNRFNRNAAKNYRYCCSPTKMIHVSSIPTDVNEEEITLHLSPHGNVLVAKVFEANGKKQALVQFETEEEATEALICKHASLFKGSTIRLAFSKSTSV